MQPAVQRGFALFELLVAAALAALAALWASQALVTRLNDAGAQAAATWMQVIQEAARDYTLRHAPQLREAADSTALHAHGFQDWRTPQLGELKAAGLLSAGFPESMRLIGGASVYIAREGVCPGPACHVSSLVYSQRAFTKRGGIVDEQMTAQWLLATAGRGAAVQPSNPATVRGPAVQYPNPLADGLVFAPGTLVLGLADNDVDYLRVGDTRDPRFQAGLSVHGDVAAGGHMTVGGYLRLESTAQWLAPCADEGAVARNHFGGLLVCTYGAWSMPSRSPGGYAVNSIYGCSTPEGRSTANPATGACTCPAGYAAVPLSEGGSTDPTRGITRGFLCVE